MASSGGYAVEELNSRVRADIQSFILNYSNILNAAPLQQKKFEADDDELEPKDKHKLAQEHQLMEGAAANMVRSCESLLTLTGELKQALLLNDFRSLTSTVGGRWITVRHQEKRNFENLCALQDELADVTREMEDALYSSPYYAAGGDNI
ncbi:Mediator of RNA polymerase II transcription subunit 22 [Borealophlyctis nickersoniae]|nr:Mediator of RNA polymerase II transcription subunit 22 [Borealophlyctis nickersoniae]